MAAPMSKSVITGCLRAIPLFSDVSGEELDVLASAARSIVARKGARIFEEGAPADCCFVLTVGEARVVLNTDDGTEILLGVVQAPCLVGEIALLDRSTRSASVVAAGDCQLIRIPSTAFEALRSNPAFERKIVAHVASTLREANDQVRAVSTFTSTARVAWCLGRIARLEGTWDGATVVIPRKPHHELAEMTGCSRETVSRALATLKRKNYVSWNDETMRLQIEGLQRYLRGELRLPARAT